MATAIRTEGLSKQYRVLTHQPGVFGAIRNLFSSAGRMVDAVCDVTLSIEAGEFVGYIGPNGAGKSTTIKMLTGILVPTTGELEVCGLNPHRDRVKNAANIGAVFGNRTQLWWDLPPIEAYRLLAKIYRVESSEADERLRELSELLELEALMNTPVRKLSLGEKMRCELAAALLHRPRVLFLDEPTIGLDAVGKEQVRRHLARINRERETTIVLTSHDLDDIEQLCPRAIVIDRGRVIHDGSVEALRRRFGHRRTLVVDFTRGVPSDLGRALPDGGAIDRQEGSRVWIEFDADRVTTPDMIRAVLAEHDVHDITVREIDIEDVVRRVYGEE